jgi:Protein of unknown function (DUF3830)
VRLRVELPDKGVRAEATLYDQAAPTVCQAIYDSLAEPLDTHTSHACFDGHEVFCFLPPFPKAPPIENRTMRPQVGEMMFFYAAPNEFACMAESRLTGGSSAIHELAFMYGEVDLRHFWEDGLHGSLVGRMSTGLDEFAAACASTLVEGHTRLRISQV